MNIWFTADTHFHHARIISYCPQSRGHFETVEDMNETLISNWNEVVKPSDEVYHLGDVGFAPATVLGPLIQRLNGVIHLVAGNHDAKLIKNHDFAYHFESITCSYREVKVDKGHVVLCHYPIARWNRAHYGQIHLHGHSHGSFVYHVNAVDVGIDGMTPNNLAPWEWSQIQEFVSKRDPDNLQAEVKNNDPATAIKLS